MSGITLNAGGLAQIINELVLLNELQVIQQPAVDRGSQECVIVNIFVRLFDEARDLRQGDSLRGRIRKVYLRLFRAFIRGCRSTFDLAFDEIYQSGSGNSLSCEQVPDHEAYAGSSDDVPVVCGRKCAHAGSRGSLLDVRIGLELRSDDVELLSDRISFDEIDEILAQGLRLLGLFILFFLGIADIVEDLLSSISCLDLRLNIFHRISRLL